MVVPIMIAALISVIMGIYPDFIMNFVKAVTG
jgi:multicomponent Na+:H+ antiporter subunit D